MISLFCELSHLSISSWIINRSWLYHWTGFQVISWPLFCWFISHSRSSRKNGRSKITVIVTVRRIEIGLYRSYVSVIIAKPLQTAILYFHLLLSYQKYVLTCYFNTCFLSILRDCILLSELSIFIWLLWLRSSTTGRWFSSLLSALFFEFNTPSKE